MEGTMGANSNNRNLTTPGCAVLLDINDGDRLAFAHLSPHASVKVGNAKCLLDPLVGIPFGSVFEVQSGPNGHVLVRLQHPITESKEKESIESEEAVESICRDNRALIDNNTAQTLSAEDIEQMRREGATGKAIIEALVANSASFEAKSAFSQEKYKRRKQKKYAPHVLVRRPSARSVCEAYFAKDPNKIGFLRMDTLALLLSLANVGANAEVLVLDMLGGLLTAAVAERLGGHGSVCSTFHTAKAQTVDMVRLFNFDTSTASRVFRVSLSELTGARYATQKAQEGKEATDASDGLQEPPCSGETFLTAPRAEENISEPKQGPIEGNKAKLSAPVEDMTRWASQGFSSLIVGAPYLDPWTVAQCMLPLLASSAPFVIYHPYSQPLAECMHHLQAEHMAVALQLSEPWLREYQVLPSRTHPNMQMSSTGGYVLSGITITNT
ncbi:unnamed protein product [Sphagnum troendelagicum]|uniref:tRNA (adenine(58)-N(1))-methyltransferase non-catalytic subunit TRM6 n=1 Tax=Sphagnum troendelagicum TaxID=128251 RepID=A0ABP0UC54_9BRYO